MKQKHRHWRLKLLHHHPHNQQSPHSPLREEEGVKKREKMVYEKKAEKRVAVTIPQECV
jgi:hypothetical protein